MIDFNRTIELIRRNGDFKPNKSDASYHKTYEMKDGRLLQVKLSNHGTWCNKDYNPSCLNNICIVFSENGEAYSNVGVDARTGENKPFEVTQYVYNCQLLDDNDAALINQAVQNISQNKWFKDPLANTHKHARVMLLI